MSAIGNLRKREYIARTLIGLSALAFLLAVMGILVGSGSIMGVDAEGLSRACTNLALIGIGLSICFKTPMQEE